MLPSDGKTVFFKFGNTDQNSNYTGSKGEITINLDLLCLHIHDGVTMGGTQTPSIYHTHSFTDLYQGGDGILIEDSIIKANIGFEAGMVMAGNASFTFLGDASGEMINGNVLLSLRDILAFPLGTTQETIFDSFKVNAKGQIIEASRKFPTPVVDDNGKVLSWDTATNTYKLITMSLTQGLNALTDVEIGSKLNNQVLMYDITSDAFINKLIRLELISDFDLTALTNGSTVVWDASVNKFICRKTPIKAIKTKVGDTVLSLADVGDWVRINVATANTLTVPANLGVAFKIGDEIKGTQAGLGQTTIVPELGVTVNAPTGKTLKLRAKGAWFTLIKVADNEWDLIGDLE